MMADNKEQRILIMTPFGKDAVHLHKVLSHEGFSCVICKDIEDLTMQANAGLGVVLITEEVLASKEVGPFVELIRRQPTWSAIPVLAFYSERQDTHALQKKAQHPLHALADVTFLQRPVGGATLFSAIKTALRDRLRQYEIRDLLNRLKVKAAAAEEANKLKSQFLANMSHEIRTPLGAIMGFLELIKDPGLTREETEEYVNIVTRNAVQLMRIIDDILDLSKVESGKMELEKVEFSLADLIFDFAALMNIKAQDKGIIFDIKIDPTVPKKVISDPVRMKQVLANAVGNAIKFTEKGKVQITCSFASSVLKFTITDSGRGISEEQSKKLFKPFVQADSSTTRNFGGTGLGLVLSRRICQEMGGDFFLQHSQLGEGSTFVATFLVEAVRDPANAALTPNMQGQTHGPDGARLLAGIKILLVEDSADNQMLIKTILRSMGAEIDIAPNGREGVARTSQNNYDIVLMDIQMPQMDGHEATRLLRSQGYKTPIIALTAHAMKEEKDRTLVSGFSGYLTKPIHRETLAQTILKLHHSQDPPI